MRRNRSLLVLIVLAALVVPSFVAVPNVAAQASPTAPAASSAGAMFRGDLGRTGQAASSVSATLPSERGRIALLPNSDPEGPPESANSPIVAGGILIVSDRVRFHAIDAASGVERWSHDQKSTFSTPAVADGVVVVGSGGQGLFAFNESTGDLLWNFRPGGPVVGGLPADLFDSSPAIVDGTVYVGEGAQGGLYALDLMTGAVRWSLDTRGGTFMATAIANGMVYTTTDGSVQRDPSVVARSSIIAVDMQTGVERWRTELAEGEIAYSGPAVVDDTVYAGISNFTSDVGHVLALDATTGAERWRAVTDGPMGAGYLAISKGLLVEHGGESGSMIALDLVTGSEQWIATGTVPVLGSPVIAGDTVLYYDNSRTLHAVALATGASRWDFVTGPWIGGSVIGAPWVEDGVIYARASGGLVVLA